MPENLMTGGRLSAAVEIGGHSSNALDIELVEASPSVLASDLFGLGQAVALNEDGTPNSPESAAAGGSTVRLELTGTGGQKIAATVGGLPAEVVSARALPGLGRTELTIRIPPGVTGAAAVRIQAGEAFSQSGVWISTR